MRDELTGLSCGPDSVERLREAMASAQLLREVVRAALARYGREACRSAGNLFGATPPAAVDAERPDVPLTASVAVATRSPQTASVEQLLKHAEERSRLASHEGGDLVWVAAPRTVQRQASR